MPPSMHFEKFQNRVEKKPRKKKANDFGFKIEKFMEDQVEDTIE